MTAPAPTLRRLAAALALLVLWPLAAAAQGTATLVADEVFVTADEVLIAEGNVEVLYDGARLSAARITYDRAADRLTIDGPVFLQGPDGEIVTADRAELDPQLENGILRGARLVLDRRLQLAASRIDRAEGRYSQLTQAAATSCQVCDGRPPLWEIRAERVTHDEEARQIWFENARFLVRGVPIAWIPVLRLPDPTNERARGILIPSIRSTNLLGIGAKLPYFLPLGPSRDLTLTPYLSPETRTLEARYRQAFLAGTFEARGAVSDDTVRPGELRYYLETDGTFALPAGYRLDISTRSTSDDAYLLDYGYSDDDRLVSDVTLERIEPRAFTQVVVAHVQSLREGEDQETLPPLFLTADRELRLPGAALGGTVTLGASLDAFLRTGGATGADGRDVARAGAFADWQAQRVFEGGLVAGAEARLGLDGYAVADDPAYPDPLLRAVPAVQTTLRWPLVRRGPGGATDILEPVVAIAWSDTLGDRPPVEDAPLVEFDEASLLALSRFPGEDAVETGWRAAFGLSWTRTTPAGHAARLSFGQVIRDAEIAAFSGASGLSGTASDYLVAGQLDLAGGFSLDLRSLVDEGLDPGKTAGQVLWSNPRVDLAAAYVWLPEDAEEGRDDAIAEWTLEADYRVTPNWSLRADARYDLAADRTARAGLGIGWRNECVTVDLSVSRRYTSSEDVEPSTDFDLAVTLDGFSAGRTAAAPPGACRG